MHAERSAEVTVLIAGRAAALNVPEHRRAYVQIGALGQRFHEVVGVSGALGEHDNAAALSACAELGKLIHDVVGGHLDFGHDNDFRAAADTCVEREVAAVSAHDLDDGNTLVRGHGVANLIDSVEYRVAGGVEAQRVIGVGKVVVDSAGNADSREAQLGQNLRAHKRAVAADDDKPLYSVTAQVFDALSPALGCLELGAASGAQDCAAALNDVGNASQSHFHERAVDKSAVTALDAHDFHAARNAVTHRRANGRVHAGRVAAAR